MLRTERYPELPVLWVVCTRRAVTDDLSGPNRACRRTGFARSRPLEHAAIPGIAPSGYCSEGP
jgi:hypothetical protein